MQPICQKVFVTFLLLFDLSEYKYLSRKVVKTIYNAIKPFCDCPESFLKLLYTVFDLTWL